jgi:hypothetical protein
MRIGIVDVEYGEVWLLDAAVHVRIPLPLLVGTDDEISRDFNRPSHFMNRDELFRTLCSLFAAGDIVGNSEERGDYVPTPAEVERALEPSPPGTPMITDSTLCYGLSTQGGARWERMTEADWDRYIQVEEPEKQVTEIVTSNKERLEDALQRAQNWSTGGWWPESVVRDVIKPWEATYWRTLPVGFRARFQCRELFGLVGISPREFRQWHKSIFERPV